MPKTRTEKNQIINNLSDRLKNNEVILIADYKGMNNQQLTELRQKVKQAGGKLTIVKNTLFKIALNKANLEIDEGLLNKPLLISTSDEITPAKIFDEIGQEAESLEILGGIYQKNYKDKQYVAKLAQIPSREELLVQLAAQLKAPQQGLVYTLKGNLQKLLMILDKLSKNKQEE